MIQFCGMDSACLCLRSAHNVCQSLRDMLGKHGTAPNGYAEQWVSPQVDVGDEWQPSSPRFTFGRDGGPARLSRGSEFLPMTAIAG